MTDKFPPFELRSNGTIAEVPEERIVCLPNTRRGNNKIVGFIANTFTVIVALATGWIGIGFVAMFIAPHNKVLTSGANFALDLFEKLVTQC